MTVCEQLHQILDDLFKLAEVMSEKEKKEFRDAVRKKLGLHEEKGERRNKAGTSANRESTPLRLHTHTYLSVGICRRVR
jgi:hypothetical protein